MLNVQLLLVLPFGLENWNRCRKMSILTTLRQYFLLHHIHNTNHCIECKQKNFLHYFQQSLQAGSSLTHKCRRWRAKWSGRKEFGDEMPRKWACTKLCNFSLYLLHLSEVKYTVSARPRHCGSPALHSEKASTKTEKGPI